MKTPPPPICYRVLIHKRLTFNSSAFMLVNSLCFNINVFVEKRHSALQLCSEPKEMLLWIAEKAARKQTVRGIHLQAAARLLLLDNSQNCFYSKRIRSRRSASWFCAGLPTQYDGQKGYHAVLPAPLWVPQGARAAWAQLFAPQGEKFTQRENLTALVLHWQDTVLLWQRSAPPLWQMNSQNALSWVRQKHAVPGVKMSGC